MVKRDFRIACLGSQALPRNRPRKKVISVLTVCDRPSPGGEPLYSIGSFIGWQQAAPGNVSRHGSSIGRRIPAARNRRDGQTSRRVIPGSRLLRHFVARRRAGTNIAWSSGHATKRLPSRRWEQIRLVNVPPLSRTTTRTACPTKL